MRSLPSSALRAILAGSLLPLALSAQSVSWAVSLEGALTEARAKGTIVMIAIQMPGERGSDELRATHYKDARICDLSAETVNLMIEVSPGRVPEDEREVRRRYLEVEPDALVAVPHHLFVDPGEAGSPGTLLSSVAYRVTVGQLEWAWADAIRKVRPEFEWKVEDRTRAPEALLYGDAETDGVPPPPSRQEVHDAVKLLRSGSREPGKIFEAYRVVLSSAEREALQYGRSEMRSLAGFLKRPAMRLVADVSPKEWCELAEDCLKDNDPRIRAEAARALERLAVDRSVRAIRKELSKEDDEEAKGRMVRAMAACGPADRNVVRELERILKRERAEAVRRQAAMAIGCLEDRDAFLELLETALADEDPTVRTAAVYVVASRRDPELAQLLEERAKTEEDTEVSGWIATANEVLKGGDLRKFNPFVRQVCGDRKPGDGARQFSIKLDDWLERVRGRRGRGGGEEGGGEQGGGEAGGGAGEGKDPGGKKRGTGGR